MSELKTKPVLVTAAGVLSLASIGGLSILGLNLAGIPILPQPEEVVAAKPTVVDARTALTAKDSPAVRTIDKLMEGTSQLQASGQVKAGGTPSLPFSCPAGNLGVNYSAARTFLHQGERIQIVASAYAAGYGPVAYSAMTQSVRNCASGVGTVNLWSEKVGPYNAIVVDFKQSAGTTRFMMVRYGDNILHLQGSGSKLHSAAQAAIDVLAASKTCANPDQDSTSFNRNPLAGTAFTGLYVKEKVTVPKPKAPKVPEDEQFEALTDEDALPVQPAMASPAAVPSYPVYPSMPKALSYPDKPEQPAKPALHSTVMVKTQDPTGPGCGWDYTGSPGAVWDEAGAREENTATVDEATALLDDGVATWSELTLAYWKDAQEYTEDVAKYLAYSEQVAKVNEAWGKISDDWSKYEHELNLWQEQKDVIEQFHEDQADAEERYAKDLERCEAEAAKPSPSPTEDPETETDEEEADSSAEPSDPVEPTKPAEPSEPAERIDCNEQVPEPSIIGQTAPESLEKPEAPADPRPKG